MRGSRERFELQLERNRGMLFGPGRNERQREIVPDTSGPVEAGVAGGAQGNEPFPGMRTRVAVMDMDPPRVRRRRGTALATKPVAEQNGFAVTAEAGLRAPGRRVAAPTEAGDGRLGLAAGAKQSLLRHGPKAAPSGEERKNSVRLEGRGAKQGSLSTRGQSRRGSLSAFPASRRSVFTLSPALVGNRLAAMTLMSPRARAQPIRRNLCNT